MNIQLIPSDQQRVDGYGFADRKLKAPHLDILAREGRRFAACITPNLVCQSTRASILSGLLPATHGVSDCGIDLPDSGVLAATFRHLTISRNDLHFERLHFGHSSWSPH